MKIEFTLPDELKPTIDAFEAKAGISLGEALGMAIPLIFNTFSPEMIAFRIGHFIKK